MTEEAITLDCPSCGAHLEYDTLTANFTCRYCGSAFSKAQLDEIYPTETKKAATLEDEIETEEQLKEKDTFSRENKLYSCPSCGAQIITDNSDTASTVCHYCNNPVILVGQLSGEFKPDKIIPFKKTKEHAIEGFKTWCGKKFFVPKDFKSERTLTEIKGIYVPFWLADCCVAGELTATCEKSSSTRSGDYRITTTKEYHVVRKGSIIYRSVPADGSSRANDLLMENIEPFNYDELVDFSMAYLSGHNAEKYDVEKETILPRISQRTCSAAQEQFRKSIKGYTSTRIKTSNFQISHINWKYALLPLWFLSYEYKGKHYYYSMNGQTGKFGGNLPIDKLKVALVGAAIGIGIMGVFLLAAFGGMLL